MAENVVVGAGAAIAARILVALVSLESGDLPYHEPWKPAQGPGSESLRETASVVPESPREPESEPKSEIDASRPHLNFLGAHCWAYRQNCLLSALSRELTGVGIGNRYGPGPLGPA